METDVKFADISLLPSSVSSAGDMPQLDHCPKPGDYESAMGEMTLESASSTGVVEPDIEVVGCNPETEAQVDGTSKE